MPSLGTLTRTLASILGYTLPPNLPSSGTSPFNPLTATLTSLRRLLKAETVTSAFLVEQYLAQIENHNTHTITPTAPKADLIEQARCLDDERMDGYVRGFMHGIPVLVEDTPKNQFKNDTSLSELLTKAGMILIARISPSLLTNSKDVTQPASPALFLPLTILCDIDSPLTQLASSLGLCSMHPTTSSYGAIARTAQDLVDVMGVLTDNGKSVSLRGSD